jgi:hypothetical protein
VVPPVPGWSSLMHQFYRRSRPRGGNAQSAPRQRGCRSSGRAGDRRNEKRHPRCGCLLVRVDLRGLEPLTPCMPCRCATSCATDPYSFSLHCLSRSNSSTLLHKSREVEHPPTGRSCALVTHRDERRTPRRPARCPGHDTASDQTTRPRRRSHAGECSVVAVDGQGRLRPRSARAAAARSGSWGSRSTDARASSTGGPRRGRRARRGRRSRGGSTDPRRDPRGGAS